MRNLAIALSLVLALVVWDAIVAPEEASAATVLSNVAVWKPATASTPYGSSYGPEKGNDDRVSSRQFSHAVIGDSDSWWSVDLGREYDIQHIEIIARWSATYMVPDLHINWATVRAYAADGATQVGSDLVLSGFDDDPFTPRLTFDNGGAGWSGVQFFQVGGPAPLSPIDGLQMAEFRAFAQVETYPGFIAGVTATANLLYSNGGHPDVQFEHLVNNVGMRDQDGPLLGAPDALSAMLDGGVWHTPTITTTLPVVTFNLGGSHDLDRMLIWNRNQPSLQDNGFKDVLIETSPDGSTYTPLADQNGAAEGNVTIAMAPLRELGDPQGDVGFQADIDLTGITASFVQVTGLNSYGGVENQWGLSEVRFYEGGGTPDVPGDANHDGKVDDKDAAALAANWLKTGGATWEQGDFNKDGNVNDLDASILAANWPSGSGSAAVPEPSTLVLLAGALVAAWWWRRW